jgi:hypothetical protein
MSQQQINDIPLNQRNYELVHTNLRQTAVAQGRVVGRQAAETVL